GESVEPEPGAVLLFQEGTDLVAWPAYEPFEAGKGSARRWPIFEERELLTSIARRGRYLFLATVRPYPEEPEEAPSALVQPTLQVVGLPEGKELSSVALPPVAAGVSPQSVVPIEHGLLHLGNAGVTFLAPVGEEEALEELRSLLPSPDLSRGERVLAATLIARRVDLKAHHCGADLTVTVDGRLDEWSGVPAVRFPAGEEDWAWRLPEVPGARSAPGAGLSGSLRLAWDKDWLYLAVEVDDDVHLPPREAGFPWRSDALIVRLVTQTLTRALGSLREQVFFGPTGKARVERRLGSTSESDRAAIGRGDGVTTYELALARHALARRGPWPPSAGEFRLALAISDRDRSGLHELLTFPRGPLSGRSLETLARVTFVAGVTAAAE
ncbi:MAG: hypothetical protein KAX80_16210, partial [Planctomycetes bacterium]|nr:hypothetical protein [Planctomycetota bacterium]